jgi:hypothetical protein
MASSNVSSVVDYFATANEGFATTLGSTISSGATTVPLAGTSGLTNGSVFVGIIEPGATNQQVFTGLVDIADSQISSVVWTRGTNNSHVGGVAIVDYVTGTAFNMMSTGIQKQHNQNGTHEAITNTGGLTTDTLDVTSTSTFAALLTAAGGIATTATAGYTAGASTTTSGSYGLLADSVSTTSTVTIGPNGLALVSISALLSNSVGGDTTFMGFALSGANTVAASNKYSCAFQAWTNSAEDTRAGTFLMTGLTAGSTVFTLQYSVSAQTATVSLRNISVIPL